MRKLYAIGRLMVLVTLSLSQTKSFSQCGPGTPTVTVDLTGSPDSTWISPLINRNDNCCGTSAPDKCVKFIVTLDPGAVGINFNVASGAVPPGALFYQINCGPPTPVGSPICLDGPGPHIITFCKPGNNSNTYSITSIPGATAGTDIVVNDGCNGTLGIIGLVPTSVTWTSIAPGTPGQYDAYLSCTSGCVNPTVTSQPGFPPFVDYVVCGTPLAVCDFPTMCDTVRVTFNPTLGVTIVPAQPTICFGQTSTTITAVGSGGTPPYTYIWNTGATTASINAGAGSFSVLLGDQSGCPPTNAVVTVTQFANPITADAGPDVTVCVLSPNVALSGSVTGVTTGEWSGGNGGTFSPNNTALNATYIPSAADLAAGTVTLTLSTTNNGTCPGATSQMTITYHEFNSTVSITPSHVLCGGGATGIAAAVVSGSFAPYTYSWNTNPVQSTATANGLTAGTYTVTVTDNTGCTGTQTVQINEPFPLSSNTTQNNVLCNGGSTGEAFVGVFGGTLPYSYLWSPTGNTTANPTNLANGTHVVTITDGNGCVHRDTVIIAQPAPLAIALAQTNVSCNGGSDGTGTANISGGTTPYSYLWSPGGSTAPNATGLSAGAYTVQVTDANGCTISGNITVTEPPLLTLALTGNDPSCFGLSNGSATASAAGGVLPYTYLWSPGGQTTATANGLAAGNHSVTVTDANGCEMTAAVTLEEPDLLVLSSAGMSPVSCFGGSDGAAGVTVSGGTPNYTYNWSPAGGTNAFASGLSANTYTVTVTDDQSCTATTSITVTQPASAVSASTVVSNVVCFGQNNGSITANPAGGTSPYTIQWLPSGNFGTIEDSLYAGNYNFIVTDANGCVFNGTASVSQPLDFTFVVNTVNTTCGGSNGSASVVTSGATGPYTYQWSPTGGTASSATNLTANSYLVIVTDAVGCTDTAVANVNDASSPIVAIPTFDHISCFGGTDGSATVTISGGTGPFSIFWLNSGTTNNTDNNLAAGIHQVMVVDGNGCDAYASVELLQPTPLLVTAVQDSLSCFGGSDGSAQAFAGGGTPGYSFSWSPVVDTDDQISNVAAGNYTVTVTDLNGCTSTVSIAVLEPDPLQLSVISSTNVSCFGGNDGTGQVSTTGGVPGYFYNWSPSGGAGSSANSLAAGSYTITVFDANMCTANTNLVITEPAAGVSVTFNTSDATCNGSATGTATAIPAGGTPGYTFSWANSQTTQTATGIPAGSILCTVTDALGCTTVGVAMIDEPVVLTAAIVSQPSTCGQSNGTAIAQAGGGNSGYSFLWSPGSSTASIIQNVPTGTYTVTVTDALGCTATASNQVNNIPGPTASITSVTPVSCFGGSNGTATVTLTAGTAPFQYNWLPTGGTGALATGLPAGNYSVIVTDANGCQTNTSTSVTQPTEVIPVINTVNHVSCFGGSDGSLLSSATGGTGTYIFAWSPSGGNAANASGLAIGNYTLTVTDQNGCTGSASATINQPSPVTVSVMNANDPICFGTNTGSINAIAGGGTPGYTFSWNTSPVQNNATAVDLPMGTYTVTVSDANGCTATISQSLSQPTQVLTSVSAGDTICGGQSTMISASASGGSAPYFYSWSAGLGNNPSHTVSPLADINYTVQVFDNFGCPGDVDTIAVTVFYLDAANLIVQANSPICEGTSSLVFATVNAPNTGPLNYTWNQNLGTGPGAFVVTPSAPTYYTVTVSNVCGGVVTDSVLVDFNPPPTIVIGSDVLSGCVPLTVNFDESSITNTADSIFSWFWTFGDGSTSTDEDPTHVYTSIGTFPVTLNVTTWGGCTNTSAPGDYSITVNPVPVAAFLVNATVLNIPYETLVCDNNSIGANTYSWTFGDGTGSTVTNPSHVYTTLGSYPVTLVASNSFNCTDTAVVIVTTTSDITFPNAFTPNSSGPNGGAYSYGDLTNDVFFPYTAGVEDYHLMIFNRWGELIFESFELAKGWDGYYRGQICQEGVYVWKVDLRFQDGRKFNKVGDVTLLR